MLFISFSRAKVSQCLYALQGQAFSLLKNTFRFWRKVFFSQNGYYGSNGASRFGWIVPAISVQKVPF